MLTLALLTTAAVLALAWTNGANDVSKGCNLIVERRMLNRRGRFTMDPCELSESRRVGYWPWPTIKLLSLNFSAASLLCCRKTSGAVSSPGLLQHVGQFMRDQKSTLKTVRSKLSFTEVNVCTTCKGACMF